MTEYKLLTPGPLTTTKTVKESMLSDRCTWDDEYKNLTQNIRKELLALGNVSAKEYTTILQQGSGSFVVESVLQTALSHNCHVLIISNGAYGERMVEMAQCIGKHVTAFELPFNERPNMEDIASILSEDDSITHVAMVHCETTTGMLNPLEALCELCYDKGKQVIIDAMSSFGGMPIDMKALHIDYLISSANKCIQGVPGFGFVIAKLDALKQTKGNANSVSLDLYSQWMAMDDDGKWRFTSPTHVVAAFQQAINELHEEGGINARYKRYRDNNTFIREHLETLGYKPYVQKEHQSPIITTFLFPNNTFDFNNFYKTMKAHGFVLYPGKLMDEPSFRIGNIGDLYKEDFEILIKHIREYNYEKGAS